MTRILVRISAIIVGRSLGENYNLPVLFQELCRFFRSCDSVYTVSWALAQDFDPSFRPASNILETFFRCWRQSIQEEVVLIHFEKHLLFAFCSTSKDTQLQAVARKKWRKRPSPIATLFFHGFRMTPIISDWFPRLKI